MSTLTQIPKRLLLGRPLSSSMGETLLPEKLALPVFCSDPLSSNAYATEEILLMLSLGGLSLLHLTPWVAGAVVLLLVMVVLSYRQTCYAYPGAGGADAVSRANLWRNAALVAASALLVDYVLTVAVSVAAGVANIVSAVPALAPHVVILSIGLVVFLALMNLRGTKESGKIFAIPPTASSSVFAMIAFGLLQMVAGHPPVAESAAIGIRAQEQASGLLPVALVLGAFASGKHGPDRGGGSQQRRTKLQEAQESQRSRDPGHHGNPDDRDVRRDHRLGADQRGARGGPSLPAGRRPAGLRPRHLRSSLAAESMLLIYMLAVVVIAVVGDVVPALLAAVASFLLVNWFLTPTYYTLAVESRDAAIDLVVFVLAASRSASASSWAPETAQQLSARGSSRG